MIDVAKAIRDYLIAQGALTALTGERIYAETDVPPAGYQPSDGACICFRMRGGTVDFSDAILWPSVQFKCYGSDDVEANTLYRVLFDVLHGVPEPSAVVRAAYLETAGETLAEPETGWPFVLTFYRMMIANE